MFSPAVRVGMRLKAWNTKPMRSRRSTVMARSLSELRSVSPTRTRPEVSRSRPARQCSSVDFPEPDGPMMAANSPAANSAVTPSSARMAVSPRPYTFTPSMICATGAAWDVLVSPSPGMTLVIAAPLRRDPVPGLRSACVPTVLGPHARETGPNVPKAGPLWAGHAAAARQSRLAGA
jgi:hypothetical protein